MIRPADVSIPVRVELVETLRQAQGERFIVHKAGSIIKQFNKTDDGYNVQQVYDTFTQAVAERSASNPGFDLEAVKFIVKMWDANHPATMNYFATSQSDDLKVFGRSARGG